VEVRPKDMNLTQTSFKNLKVKQNSLEIPRARKTKQLLKYSLIGEVIIHAKSSKSSTATNIVADNKVNKYTPIQTHKLWKLDD